MPGAAAALANICIIFGGGAKIIQKKKCPAQLIVAGKQPNRSCGKYRVEAVVRFEELKRKQRKRNEQTSAKQPAAPHIDQFTLFPLINAENAISFDDYLHILLSESTVATN